MHVDPKVQFWIGVIISIATGVSAGTVSLTGIIPHEAVPEAVAICGLVAFIGNIILTSLNGISMTNSSRLAAAGQVPIVDKLDALAKNNPEVQSIITTQALADATDSAKVVGPPKATGVH